MIKCSPLVILASTLLLTTGLGGCGSTRSNTGVTPPASIALSPSSASLDLGQTQQFTATAQNSAKNTITVTITYNSSNTAVLTITNAGLACAGSWDSLTNPITCTPGPSGVAMVTASSAGVVSPPVTVYVHQHVDSISITPVNPPSPNCNRANAVGISQNQTVNYQAAAFSHGIDVTSTVGPFTWTAASPTVVKLNSGASGLLSNQVQATASTPGLTQISAAAAGVSGMVDFLTCPVKSVTLTGAAGSGNAVSIIKGSTSSITATVIDSLSTVLSGVPLTWCSSEPAAVSVGSSNCSSSSSNPMTVTGALVGGADVTASCTPPSCNGGIFPSIPIYPDNAIAITVNPTSQTASQQTTSAYVATTECGNNLGCTSSIAAIAVPGNNVSGSTTLSNTPNSLVFDRQGKNAFLGSENGLMMFVPGTGTGTVSVFNKVTGKVLAVSPDGNKIIISDTLATPNQVFIFDVTNTGSPVSLLISGATAAAFSPDSLKGYIVAGNTLYVYSAVDAIETVTLFTPPASATDLTFLPAGSFAYVTGSSVSAGSVTPVTTCTNGVNPSVATSGLPALIRRVLDGTHLLAMVPSGIDVIGTKITAGGCPPAVTTSAPQFVNLGQGQFTPAKFLVSSDGTKAYILASNLGAVLVYDIAAGTSSAIPLTGNVTAVNGDITLDGSLLYVAASDGTVHAVSTVTGGDVQTISFPTNFTFCNNVSFVCRPDLVAVQP